MIWLSAPLECPRCARECRGFWPAGRETAPQRCPGCLSFFTAAWPGFDFRAPAVKAPDADAARAAARAAALAPPAPTSYARAAAIADDRVYAGETGNLVQNRPTS